MVCAECRFVNVLLEHEDLMVARAKVQFSEELSDSKLVQEFFHNWNRELVLRVFAFNAR